MIVKQYDLYQLKLNETSYIDINTLKESDQLYYLRLFFLWGFRRIKHNIPQFIHEIEDYPQDKFLFDEFEINFDQKNNLIYLNEGWSEYHDKSQAPEIEKLFDEDNYIQLCKIGFLDYMIINKDNFFNLLLTWDKILNELPPFALLYLDDKNWYNVLPFHSQEAMEKFVDEHVKK